MRRRSSGDVKPCGSSCWFLLVVTGKVFARLGFVADSQNAGLPRIDEIFLTTASSAVHAMVHSTYLFVQTKIRRDENREV